MAAKDFGCPADTGERGRKKNYFAVDSFGQHVAAGLSSHGSRENLNEIAILPLLEGFEAANSLKANTKSVRGSLRIIRRFLRISRCSTIANLTPAVVEEWLAALQTQGYSPKSLINAKSAVSTFCRFLKRRGYIQQNPCSGIELAKPQETAPAVFDQVELDEVLRLARQYGLYCEVAVAAYTGLRRGELARLAWAQVDLDNRVLTVVNTKNRQVRAIPLLATPLDALREQRAITGMGQWVFPARVTYRGGWKYTDRPIGANTLGRHLNPLAAVIENFHSLPKGSVGNGWHLFRHSFGTMLSSVSSIKAMAWMGHSSMKMLQRYTHLRPRYDPEIEKILAK